ncbi:MAG: PAS domain S-box protein, partial [Candidatus Margulisbacteria bacterium]|nr:PAS domain S-box protein [Candidatus Margulisiibacteriota bacterium]
MRTFFEVFGIDREEIVPLVDWFIKFRIAAAVAILTAWLILYSIYFKNVLPFWPAVSLCVAELVLTFLYYLWLKTRKLLALLGLGQLWLDIVFLVVGVHFTGGSNSYVSLIIIFPIVSAGLLSLSAGLATVVFASAVYLTLLGLELVGAVPSLMGMPFALTPVRITQPIILISSLFLLVIQLNYFTQNLRRKTREIVESRTEIGELRRQLEKKLEETNGELYLRNKELESLLAERKLSEKVIKESEERYKTLTEKVLDAILILDRRGKVIFGNQAAANMFGFGSVEDGVGRNAFDFVAPGYKRKVARDLIMDFLGKGRVWGEYKVVNKEGREFWVETMGGRINFQGQPALIASIRDITKRMEAEQAVLREKEKLEVLQKNTAALVSTLDRDELLKKLVDNAREVSQAWIAVVTLYDKANNQLQVKFTSGLNQPIIQEALKILGVDPTKMVYKVGEGTVSKWIMINRKPYVTESLFEMLQGQINENLCKAAQKLTGLNKFIALPLFAANNFLGSFIFFLKGETEVDMAYL